MIRTATIEDAERLVEIYDYYVQNTAITFEYVTPSVEEFRNRIQHTLEKYPYIVSIRDNKIMGYAYVGTFKGRAAYDWCVETSIYVDKDAKKMGIGKELYAELERICKSMNITNMCACITAPHVENDPYADNNSIEYHEHLGYSLVGRFHECGYKFDRWYDMVWYEKMINDHKVPMDDFIPFNELNM